MSRDEFFTYDPSNPPEDRRSGGRWDSSSEQVGMLGVEVHMPLYWARVGAALVDYGIPIAIYIWLYTLSDNLGVLGEAIVIACIVANNIILQGKTGSSVGKKLFGMRVCYLVDDVRASTAYYAHCSTVRTAWRQMAHAIDFFLFWGWIRPWWNRSYQTYAESITSTVVVRKDKRMHIWNPDEIAAHKRGERWLCATTLATRLRISNQAQKDLASIRQRLLPRTGCVSASVSASTTTNASHSSTKTVSH